MSHDYKIHIYLLLFILCVFCAYYAFVDIRSDYSAIPVGIVASLLCFLFLVINKVRYLKDRNWASFEILFFTLFWVLHFLSSLAWLLGYPLETVDYVTHVSGLLTIEHLSRVTFLSTIGAVAFTLAFILFCQPSEKVLAKRPDMVEGMLTQGVQLRQLYTVQTYAQYISIAALALMIVTAGADYFRSAYSGDMESYASRIAALIFRPFFRIGFISWCICLLMDRITIPQLAMSFYYIGVMTFILVLGDRGEVAVIGVSALSLVGLIRFPLKLWQFIAVLLVTGVLFSFAGDARQSDRRTLDSFVKQGIEIRESKVTTEEPPIFGAMQEYSHTALPALLMAVKEVPEHTSYFYGYFTMKGILGIVPFHAKIFPFFGDEDRYASSADYITWLFFGDSCWMINGMGTTIVAEPYLDGGVAGVFFALFLVGALGGIFYRNARFGRISIDDFVLYSIFTSCLTLATRSGPADVLIRGVLWTSGIYYFLKLFSYSLKRTDKKAKKGVLPAPAP